MAKYCSKCGKLLPEGVEMCPICHGRDAGDGAAAPFTHMTAETEIWKEPAKPEKKKKKPKPGLRERIILYGGAVVLIGLTVFILLFTRPEAVVERALKAESYDRALTVYSDKLMGKENRADETIGTLLEDKALEVCEAFETGEIDAETAESLFRQLYAFGLNSEGLDGMYQHLAELQDTRTVLGKGERLILNGKYLDACDEFRSISTDDPEYAHAQVRANDSLKLYAEEVLKTAEKYAEDKNYTTAIETLVRGDQQLKKYGTFSSGIDEKLTAYCSEYEQYTLEEAERLASLANYDNAIKIIAACGACLGEETGALTAAREHYEVLAVDKAAEDAVVRAENAYAEGNCEDAFKTLETAISDYPEKVNLETALRKMELSYIDDCCSEAKEVLAGDRENLDEAIAVIDDALALRVLEELEEFRGILESYRPLCLTECEYLEREGDIYRSTSEFEQIGGEICVDGWIWGGEGACISFAADGCYDELTADFAVRRDDGTDVQGSFEVWCDEECIFTSETLEHSGMPLKISCEITGCQVLKLIFHCDYETSTAENGFCYHGLCVPQLLKSME